jgi:hypothetical protein
MGWVVERKNRERGWHREPGMPPFQTRDEAKAAFARMLLPDLEGADVKFCAKHFDQYARNMGTTRVRKLLKNEVLGMREGTSLRIEIENLPLTREHVRIELADEGGVAVGEATAVAGYATAHALLDLVEKYTTKPEDKAPRALAIRVRIAALKATIGHTSA